MYLIDMFTLKKAGSSGNGNPAFLWKDQYKKTAEMIVNGHPADYAKDIMGSLNIFTNTMYFNYGSFVMLISASVLLLPFSHVVKKK
ncbi:hypothetical protein O3V59_21315 [Brevibacillus thermoruber]|uniref:Uncharacterized protein n=1 Tax=Brevibacillus thermoruber TaxID=33942 RepID=A0A9X3Z5I2_9BACL|nr:hypothetical protein [Brevibacillus thermoruber]MDA5110883.1 hypothetical protein [Brevibacillus thermoruber]